MVCSSTFFLDGLLQCLHVLVEKNDLNTSTTNVPGSSILGKKQVYTQRKLASILDVFGFGPQRTGVVYSMHPVENAKGIKTGLKKIWRKGFRLWRRLKKIEKGGKWHKTHLLGLKRATHAVEQRPCLPRNRGLHVPAAHSLHQKLGWAVDGAVGLRGAVGSIRKFCVLSGCCVAYLPSYKQAIY